MIIETIHKFFRKKHRNKKPPTHKIPPIERDGPLITRLLSVAVVGFDLVWDEESRRYLRLLVRLCDKAHDEYMIMREYLLEEIQTKDVFAHRMQIINHAENCISALNRGRKILLSLHAGVRPLDEKGLQKKNVQPVKKDYQIYEHMNKKLIKKLLDSSVPSIRNQLEHIDENIYWKQFNGYVFLDVDKNYTKLCLNNKQVTFKKLSSLIEQYHQLMLDLLLYGLPKQKDADGTLHYRSKDN